MQLVELVKVEAAGDPTEEDVRRNHERKDQKRVVEPETDGESDHPDHAARDNKQQRNVCERATGASVRQEGGGTKAWLSEDSDDRQTSAREATEAAWRISAHKRSTT